MSKLLNVNQEQVDKWQTESYVETLIEYQKIQEDKERLERAKALLRQKQEDILKALG